MVICDLHFFSASGHSPKLTMSRSNLLFEPRMMASQKSQFYLLNLLFIQALKFSFHIALAADQLEIKTKVIENLQLPFYALYRLLFSDPLHASSLSKGLVLCHYSNHLHIWCTYLR